MPSTLAARSLISLAILALLVLCGVQAGKPAPQSTPCTASTGPVESAVHVGDEVDQDVVIDSLDPVDEDDAFEEYLVSRHLLQCRKCKCLPRCSRCLIMSCRDGVCAGLCKMPSPTHKCTILRCSRAQSSTTF